jgi:hypothetical protein
MFELPRRCPHHPNVIISSPDGQFDGVCGPCEAESDEWAVKWDHDPTNPRRRYCGGETSRPTRPEPFRDVRVCEDHELPF